jgi:hypothetical protein
LDCAGADIQLTGAICSPAVIICGSSQQHLGRDDVQHQYRLF